MLKLIAVATIAALFVTNIARADDEPVDEPPPQPLPPPEPIVVEVQPVPVVAPPAAKPLPPVKPPPRKHPPVTLTLDGGYGIRTVQKLPVHGGELGLGIGAQPLRYFAVGGAARLFIGSTEAGLGVKGGRATAEMSIVLDRFRIVLEPGFFIVGVGRVTFAQTIVGGGPCIALGARLDAFRDDTYALFLRVAGDAGVVSTDGSLVAGATFGVGLDFDVVRGDRETLP